MNDNPLIDVSPTILVFTPEVRNLQSIFNQLSTDPKVPCDLSRTLIRINLLPERCKWDKCCGANTVGFLLIRFAIVAVEHAPPFIFGYHRKPVGLMTQENVTNLFHQSRLRT